MAQKRYFELRTVLNGQTTYSYVSCHSPKDFLKHATMKEGEKAKAGSEYRMPDGATLAYKPINKGYYESCIETLKAGEANVTEETPSIATAENPFDEAFYSEPFGADEIGVTDEQMEAIANGEHLTNNCAACAGAKFVGVADGKCGTHADDREKAKGVIRFCKGNGALQYEAEYDNGDTAVYFATKSEARAFLRDEKGIEDITDLTSQVYNASDDIRLRLAVNEDEFLTGESDRDHVQILNLIGRLYLNKFDYEMLCKLANDKGIGVAVPADSMLRFNKASGIYDEAPEVLQSVTQTIADIEARKVFPPTVALLKAPEPSRNSKRGKGTGAMFGRVCKLKDDLARAERRIQQQEVLLSNARIREMELRAQGFNVGE
jgi:hypothetical protein